MRSEPPPGPFLTELARAVIPAFETSATVLDFVMPGRGASPDSGGGVGGKTLRLMGGADCWRVEREVMSFRTKFEAAKEMFSVGRSSLARAEALICSWRSVPAKPVKALALSDEATRRALPR